MELGLFTQRPTVDATIADVRTAAEAGFASVWMPQIFGIDTLTTLAIAAREVPNLKFGTAVIPTFPRHPMMLAAQARTVQQIAGGRFTLGIGLSHQMVIENMLGMSWEKPVRHLREYLDVLLPLVRGEAADATGETLSAHLELDIPDSTPIEVLVAALGTQMLNVTGRLAEGTGTWMTGPETIRTHIAPTINAAAAGAGRPTPRIVCSLPVCVTDDEAASRAKAAEEFLVYGFLPSYRSMLDLEGVEGPADVAIIGDANTVRAGIERIMEAGATEFVAVPFSNREATIEVLQSMM